MRLGFRLRGAGRTYPWRDVFVAVRCAPPGSALAAAMDPRMAWTVDQILAAERVDQMNQLMWSLGGGKGRRPKPVPRPWDIDDRDERIFRGVPMTTERADRMAAAWKSGQLAIFESEPHD